MKDARLCQWTERCPRLGSFVVTNRIVCSQHLADLCESQLLDGRWDKSVQLKFRTVGVSFARSLYAVEGSSTPS